MSNVLLNKVVCETTEKLYLNGELADVHFVFKTVDNVQRIPANKAILAVRSPVFSRMFFGMLKEVGNIEIVDTDADAFKEFLQFFYLSKVTLSMENLCEVIRLADMYDIIDYVRSSGPTFDGKLTIDNICWAYQLAIYLKHEKLIKMCEKKIRCRPKKIFASEGFKRIDRETLKRMLELSDLECDEMDVFNASLAWAKSACREFGLNENRMQNVKVLLDDCLESIRFSEMQIGEFDRLTELHNGLFTPEEIIDIKLMLTEKEYEPKIFNQNPRRYRWNKEKALECRWKPNFRDVHLLEEPEIISFISNYPALLGEIHGPGTRYDCFVNVTIMELGNFHSKDSPKMLYEGEFQAFCDYPLQIDLPQPVVIKPQTLYEVRLNIIDPYDEIHPNWNVALQTGNFQVELDKGLKIDFYQRDELLNNPTLRGASVSCFCFNRIHTDIY